MKQFFATFSPSLDPERKVGVARQQRIVWTILGSHFALMFLLAFILPTDYQDMPWVIPLAELLRQWAPNLTLIAARTAHPNLFEAYLGIGLVMTVIAFAVGVITIPGGYSYVPFHSVTHKTVMLGIGILFVLAIGSYYLWPGMIGGKLGPFEGRSGAVFALALSGRVGMATFLNFFCCFALLFGFLGVWIAISEPITSAKDFSKFQSSNHAKD